MPDEMSQEERDLLMLLQDRFPLTEEPFACLGEHLGWREHQVRERVVALKESGLLRQIGAIFDTRRLGYRSTLVALCVQPEYLDGVAARISQHAGVSHNYQRDHMFNLWFTLAVPPDGALEQEVQALADQRGVVNCLILPTLRTFKIDVRLDLGLEATNSSPQPSHPQASLEAQLDAQDISFVRVLQEDLPVVQRPFVALAEGTGIGQSALLDAARRLLCTGTMRRYGATLRHRQAGYLTNAMLCWGVQDAHISLAGQAAATHPAVSHCYQRPACPPAWPYQLFTMVHCRSEDELKKIVSDLCNAVQPRQFAVLRTGTEFKKVRLRYFDQSRRSSYRAMGGGKHEQL